MNNTTYDVRLWKMDIYRGAKVTTYTVRWKVADKPWKEPFRNKAQALSFESELRTAARKGEAFDMATGRPVSWGRPYDGTTWYDFAVSYADMKWPDASANHRHDISWALLLGTLAMLTPGPGKPSNEEIRTALRDWAFKTKKRPDCPEPVALTLKWVARNTEPVASLSDPKVTRQLLDALRYRLDGKPYAPSTIRRNRAILRNACEYAVELGLLPTNPMRTIKWKVPRVSAEVDRRSVVNPKQASALLAAVAAQKPTGTRLVTFFAVIYYAALRPEEVANLRRENIALPARAWNSETQSWEDPADDWGELRFCSASPEVGADWTDNGESREERRLKGRADGEWRRVPTPPPLTKLLRTHLAGFGTTSDGLVFCGLQGRRLAASVVYRAWNSARRTAFSDAEAASPLAKRPYDLRHACVSTWLNGGVPAPQVAEWAGHSVEVLLRIYAKCIDGQDQAARRRIEEALGLDETPEPDEAPEPDDAPET